MELRLTDEARHYVEQEAADVITIESFVVAGCCNPELPPKVELAEPQHPGGFEVFSVDAYTVYYDTLLPLPETVELDLKDYGNWRELVVKDWEARTQELAFEF